MLLSLAPRKLVFFSSSFWREKRELLEIKSVNAVCQQKGSSLGEKGKRKNERESCLLSQLRALIESLKK